MVFTRNMTLRASEMCSVSCVNMILRKGFSKKRYSIVSEPESCKIGVTPGEGVRPKSVRGRLYN